MEKKGLVVCDTNILIEVIDRNNNNIIESLIWYFSDNDLCISSITYSEMLTGARDKRHQSKLLAALEKFVLVPLNQEIDKIHRDLIRQYFIGHNLQIQDALIASTAIYYDIPLFTLNKKDFRFVEGLKIVTPIS